jgi:hypothetical protein
MKSKYLIFALVVVLFLLFPSLLFGWGPYGYGPPWGHGPGTGAAFAGLRIQRGADADNYYVTVRLSGIQPQAVAVTVQDGRWLVIRSEAQDEVSYQGGTPDLRGYAQGFSYNDSRQARRLRLPPDADASAMQREDQDGQIRITLPRRR